MQNSQCRTVVIGAGGHAKVVVSTLQAAGKPPLAILDDDPSTWGKEILGVTVRGPIGEPLPGEDISAIIAIGSNATRKQMADRLPIRWTTAVHPWSYVHASSQVGMGTTIFAGAVVQPQCLIGEHVIINTSASVDHDCIVHSFVHLSPGVRLAGNVQVDTGAWLGIGSVVLPGVQIGAWATVGAGAVVICNIPEGAIAKGVPATWSAGPTDI